MEEVWKKTYINELYEVSNYGRVRSFMPRGRKTDAIKKTMTPRILSVCVGKSGYCFVTISGKHLMVHRLVAAAFLEKNHDGLVVNHKNGIKTDNRVENLEWCTQAYNLEHARTVLQSRSSGYKRFKEDRILCVETGKKFVTTRDASIKTGVDRGNIIKVLNGKRKKAGGYVWKWLS